MHHQTTQQHINNSYKPKHNSSSTRSTETEKNIIIRSFKLTWTFPRNSRANLPTYVLQDLLQGIHFSTCFFYICFTFAEILQSQQKQTMSGSFWKKEKFFSTNPIQILIIYPKNLNLTGDYRLNHLC